MKTAPGVRKKTQNRISRFGYYIVLEFSRQPVKGTAITIEIFIDNRILTCYNSFEYYM